MNEFYCDDGRLVVERFHECDGVCYGNVCRDRVYGGGGSGSSSGGSVAPVVFSGESYDWDGVSFLRLNIEEGDRIVFDFSGSEYVFLLSDVSGAVISVSLAGEDFVFNVGDSNGVDLDGDDVDDISVKAKGINLVNGLVTLDLNG